MLFTSKSCTSNIIKLSFEETNVLNFKQAKEYT